MPARPTVTRCRCSRKGTDDSGQPTTTKVDGWTFVSIGASWCQPCKKELAAWDALAQKYAAKATYFAVDIDDKPSDGIHLHRELGLENLSRLYEKGDSRANLADAVQTTYIVDPGKGVIRYVECGYGGSASVQAVEAELKEAPLNRAAALTSNPHANAHRIVAPDPRSPRRPRRGLQITRSVTACPR